jgi:hypothetical protein
MAYCFAKSTKLAGFQLAFGTPEKAFYDAKIKTATFFFERILPQSASLFLAIKAGEVR